MESTGRCESCIVLREWLENATQEKRYYQELLLKKAGIIGEEQTAIIPEEYLPISSHSTSLTRLRRELEIKSRPNATPANDTDLTPGEKIFQESLKNGKEVQHV